MSGTTVRMRTRQLSVFVALLVGSGASALLAPETAPADSQPLVPSATAPVTAAADALRTQVSGIRTTQLSATVWPAGAAQPAAATVTRTDSEAPLQAPAAVAVSAYLYGTAAAPAVVAVRKLQVTTVR